MLKKQKQKQKTTTEIQSSLCTIEKDDSFPSNTPSSTRLPGDLDTYTCSTYVDKYNSFAPITSSFHSQDVRRCRHVHVKVRVLRDVLEHACSYVHMHI